MATSEVQQIVEPPAEVQGVESRYLRAEVEAAVNMVKSSSDIQLQHHGAAAQQQQQQEHTAGNPISGPSRASETAIDDSLLVQNGPAASETAIESNISTSKAEATESETELTVQKAEEATTNNVATEQVHENADDVSKESSEEERRPQILDKSGDADTSKEAEETAADNDVHQDKNSTEAEAIETGQSAAEATTSDDKADGDANHHSTPSLEAESRPVERVLPEVELKTKEQVCAALQPELQPQLATKSAAANVDATEAGVSSEDKSMDKVEQQVHDEPQSTSVGEAAKETVKVPQDAESLIQVPKEESTQEELPGDDGVDVKSQEPVKGGGQDLQIDNPSPDTKLQTCPDGDKQGLENDSLTPSQVSSVEETNEASISKEQEAKETMEEEPKTEGLVEHGEPVEDAEIAEEGIGEGTTHETDEKPSLETSEGVHIITPLEDKKEETEEINKDTTETIDAEPSQSLEAIQDRESSVTTGQTFLESDILVKEVESNESSKEASETGKVSEKAEQLVIPTPSEAEGSSSSKLDDATQEKAEIPKEEGKEDMLNETNATYSIEQDPVEEDLQKDEKDAAAHPNIQSENAGEVEHSTPRDIEQIDEVVSVTVPSDEAEIITETETETLRHEEKKHHESLSIIPVEDHHQETKAETDESTETDTSVGREDKDVDVQKNEVEEILQHSSVSVAAEAEAAAVSVHVEEDINSREINFTDNTEQIEVSDVVQEQKEHESGAAQENPEVLVPERTIQDDKPAVVRKEEVPEIIQVPHKADEFEATKGMQEAIEPPKSENVLESLLEKQAEKENVPEEKASAEPEEGGASVEEQKPRAESQIEETDETKQVTSVTEEVSDGAEKRNVEESNEEKPVAEEPNSESKDCITEADEITKPNFFTEEVEKPDDSGVKETDTHPIDGERVDPAEETLMKETVVEDDSLNRATVTEVAEETTSEEAEIHDKAINKSDVKSKEVITTESLGIQEDEPALGQADHNTVCESGNPEEQKLEAAVIHEEVKEDVELVAESHGVELAAESAAIPESPEILPQEYETKVVTENTEEKTRDVLVLQHDIQEEPLDLHTTEEISLEEMEPRQIEVDSKEEGAPAAAAAILEDEIKGISQEVLEVATEEKAAEDESVKKEESEAKHQQQPSALILKEEGHEGSTTTEETKELLETELGAEGEPVLEKQVAEKAEVSKVEIESANVTEKESSQDALEEEIPVSDEMEQYQDASDSTLKTISEFNEAVPEVQALEEKDKPEDKDGEAHPDIQLEGKQVGDSVRAESKEKTVVAPEEVEDTPKQTEGEYKAEEDLQELKVPQLDQEIQAKEIGDEVTVASAYIVQEEAREIPEATAETASAAKEASEEAAKDVPEQEEKEEELILNQMEPEVEKDVQESKNLQEGDAEAETPEEPLEVSESLSTSDSPAFTAMAEEPIRPEQSSREFQVPELEKHIDEGTVESEEDNHKGEIARVALAEETKEFAEVVTNSGSQEAKGPGENESHSLENLLAENPEEQSNQTSDIKTEASAATIESMLVKQQEVEPKASDDESLIRKEIIVEPGLPKEAQEQKEDSESMSNYEFKGFEVAKQDKSNSDQPLSVEKSEQAAGVPPAIEPQKLQQQVTAEISTENQENGETAKPSEITSGITTEIAQGTPEVSHQEVITKPEDNVVNETQQEESTAEQVIKEKEIVQAFTPPGIVDQSKESQPETEQKAEKISEEGTIEPKEIRSAEPYLKTDDASQPIEDKMTTDILGAPLAGKESIPNEEDGKPVEKEEVKLNTEERAREIITEEATIEQEKEKSSTSEAVISTGKKDASPDHHNAAEEKEIPAVSDPAKISLFDMMQESSRGTQVDLGLTADEKEQKAMMTGDESKEEAEKAKSEGEKEGEGEEHDEHKNDSGSDGLVIVEAASKEIEATKVVSPRKKSHNILSEVGSKVKHSISKVKKVITGKSSSNHSKQNSPPK